MLIKCSTPIIVLVVLLGVLLGILFVATTPSEWGLPRLQGGALLLVLDVIAGVMIVVSLWNVTKDRRWWIVYMASNAPFLYVTLSKGLIGLPIMGTILMCTGLMNYLREGKKNPGGVDSKYLWGIIEDLTDSELCRYDHHGYCQEHSWFEDDRDCPQKRIRVIRSLPECRKIMKELENL